MEDTSERLRIVESRDNPKKMEVIVGPPVKKRNFFINHSSKTRKNIKKSENT
jgi:hypothetical protein